MLHKHFFIEMVLEGQFIQKFGQISQEWQICVAINTKQYLFRTKIFQALLNVDARIDSAGKSKSSARKKVGSRAIISLPSKVVLPRQIIRVV